MPVSPWTAGSLLPLSAGQLAGGGNVVSLTRVPVHAAASCEHHSGSKLHAVHGWQGPRPLKACQTPAAVLPSVMRFQIFFSGVAILALGYAAMEVMDGDDRFGFLAGALTLGGALIICGLFSLRMRWHGIIGAGVIALLGASRGIENLAELPKFWIGDRPRGPAPLLESAVAIICILLLVHVVRTLFAEKRRRLRDDEPDA
jgi:hypothetical protein